MGTLITYRRTGGVLSLLILAGAVTAVAAVGVTLLIGGAAIGAVGLLARTVLPARRRQTDPAATPWPQETFEGTLVTRDDNGPPELDPVVQEGRDAPLVHHETQGPS